MNESPESAPRRWTFGPAVLDESAMTLAVNGEPVGVERKSLEVLRYLLRHAGKLVTKDDLLGAVWPGRVVSETVLTKAIHKLREALGKHGAEIVATVHGYGYRLDGPVEYEELDDAGTAQRAVAQDASAETSAPVPSPSHAPAGRRIFISHATADKATALALCDHLEQRGHACWMAPRDIPPGAAFADAIIQAIGDAGVLLVICSDDANRSEHVAREVERAVTKKVRVLPLRIGDSQATGSLEYLLSGTQWLDLPADPRNADLDRVEKALGTMGSAPAKAMPVATPAPGAVYRQRWAMPAALALVAGVVLAAYFALRTQPVEAVGKSVAVLPFTNMSADEGNAWFTDGMQDEILTHLARIRDLKVISRTSVEKYRGGKHDLRTIARELDVATVVEGAVQRVGNRVRINVQLIDAGNDAHLWADSYDRDVSDVFAVQTDIARSVANSLRATLLPAEAKAVAAIPTDNPKAYDSFLQANHLLTTIFELPYTAPEETLERTEELFGLAIEQDPDFALAHANFARFHMWMFYFWENNDPVRLAKAKAAADRALALQPDLAEARISIGMYHYWGHRDYATARAEFERAVKAQPNNDFAIGFLAAVTRRAGQVGESLLPYQRAAELNPQSPTAWRELADTYSLLHRQAEAESVYDRAVAVSGGALAERLYRTNALVRIGRPGALAELRELLAPLKPGSKEHREHIWSIWWLHWLSRNFEALPALMAEIEGPWVGYYYGGGPQPKARVEGQVLERTGDKAGARKAYEEALSLLMGAQPGRADDPSLYNLLGWVYAGLGRRQEALANARKSVELMPVEKDAFLGPLLLGDLAQILAHVGENDEAIAIIRRLQALPYGWSAAEPGVMRIDPAWDPLRSDPRFEELANRDLSPPPG